MYKLDVNTYIEFYTGKIEIQPIREILILSK